jgi:hypothetical protein
MLVRSFILLLAVLSNSRADEFDAFVKPLFAEHCVKCHGGEKVKGKVDLKQLNDATHFLTKPELIDELIKVIDANDMPPEDEPLLSTADRDRLLGNLKDFLRKSATGSGAPKQPLHRLNRFQYNNSVRDLFQLKRDVFSLPEKLMTRQGDYLNAKSKAMPDKVNVFCRSLNSAPGLQDVNSFPKDLRASHGFDNQANQLTLSPLLLDAFLKLSVSILESPDFNENTVGIWNRFFKEPDSAADLRAEIRNRLTPFLRRAFRHSVDDETIDRYTDYAIAQTERGLPFTDAMKKAASAILSSPKFLYQFRSGDATEEAFELASRLSYFLWGSQPDEELLQLAESGDLSKPDILNATIARMLADAKIERFLDTFPGQWMQLENVLAATPDPKMARFFDIDKSSPASIQMVLEPLLLFDAIFLEDRPIIEFIKPTFAYQSDFLRTWYTSDFKPPEFDLAKLIEENKANEERGKSLEVAIQNTRTELDALIDPVRSRILAARQKTKVPKAPVDLKPFAAWEFDGDMKDSVGQLDLKAHGKVRYEDGLLVLENNAFLESKKLPVDLKSKTLEVWCKVHDINQTGGGVMGIQGPGDLFDTIVLGERKPKHWISGSNGFARTEDFDDSTPEEVAMTELHLIMVYGEDGTTTLYRNGRPYGKPFRKNAATFLKNQTSVIFGLRHFPAGGNKHLSVSLARARLYDRALTPEEAAASADGSGYIANDELLQAMTPEQQEKKAALAKSLEESQKALRTLPKPKDPGKAKQESINQYEREIVNKLRSPAFERVAATDPRYGGIITNAAMASMTSGPDRTHPIARGAWIIEVILNDPPAPPPNDVPPLNEDDSAKDLTIREKFAEHRKNPECAGCHSRLDPLGFAMENFDITGRWRDKYDNGRDVDASGTLMKKHPFAGIVDFKESLVKEEKRFARAFTAHLLRFALTRELTPADSLTIDQIIAATEEEHFKIQALIREIIVSDVFQMRP